mmetsp:Transcript_23518/g.60519  ORF Transcript_23518/g.60519 Transcript_23518/m.60519 type:complete len:241 (+) Transcript_23518:1203-1925(+)
MSSGLTNPLRLSCRMESRILSASCRLEASSSLPACTPALSLTRLRSIASRLAATCSSCSSEYSRASRMRSRMWTTSSCVSLSTSLTPACGSATEARSSSFSCSSIARCASCRLCATCSSCESESTCARSASSSASSSPIVSCSALETESTRLITLRCLNPAASVWPQSTLVGTSMGEPWRSRRSLCRLSLTCSCCVSDSSTTSTTSSGHGRLGSSMSRLIRILPCDETSTSSWSTVSICL